MLTKFDDYPIHQTPEPVAHPASSDRNVYDRYWFNGYTDDGEFYFAVGMGLYPNRGIIDCGFSIVRDGEQHAFHASKRATGEPADTTVGPFRIEVVEPMMVSRVRAGAERDGDRVRPDVHGADGVRGGGAADAAGGPPADAGLDAVRAVRALAGDGAVRREDGGGRRGAGVRDEGPLVGAAAGRGAGDGRRAGAASAAGVLPLGADPLGGPLHALRDVRGRERVPAAPGRGDRAGVRVAGRRYRA